MNGECRAIHASSRMLTSVYEGGSVCVDAALRVRRDRPERVAEQYAALESGVGCLAQRRMQTRVLV